MIKTDNAPRPEGIYSLEDIVRTEMEQQEGTEEHQWRHQGDHREAKGRPVGRAIPNMLFFPSIIKGPSQK